MFGPVGEQPFMERANRKSVIRRGLIQEEQMKQAIVALSAVALIASAPAVLAKSVSSKTPGHEMQQKGPKKGTHGASGYSPGHQMQAKGSRKGPGASGYAPGQTTGASTSGMSGPSSTTTKSK
jgi:hypothetical protein